MEEGKQDSIDFGRFHTNLESRLNNAVIVILERLQINPFISEPDGILNALEQVGLVRCKQEEYIPYKMPKNYYYETEKGRRYLSWLKTVCKNS